MEQMYEGTNLNNICGMLFLREKVDLELLEKAVRIFIKNNKAMNINIANEKSEIQQQIFYFLNTDILINKIQNLNQLQDLEKI